MQTLALRTILTISIVVASQMLWSQTVYQPTDHEVYPFLKRMEAKQLLKNYRDDVKPIARTNLAGFLHQLEERSDRLTEFERSELNFLKGEFAVELARIDTTERFYESRWNLYETDLHGGALVANVVVQGRSQSSERVSVLSEQHGAQIYGSAFERLGFYFNFMDSYEKGNGINFARTNSPEQGVVPSSREPELLNFDFTNIQFSYSLPYLTLSLEKFENVWGPGRHGQVTFSKKAPPAPQFKMRAALTDWMDFTYILADLNSDVIDSSASYFPQRTPLFNLYRTVYRLKYLAAHEIEITPVDGLDIALGESIVFSDKPVKFIYLLPIMFFKSAEDYNRDTDNSQIFLSVDANLIPNVNLYYTLFIDEMNTLDVASSTSRNQIGQTFGFQSYDVGMKNLELQAEYTRMNPWAYSHKYPATTFTNSGFDLGHWIGQNADLLSFDIAYKYTRALKVGVFSEVFRKGGRIDVWNQYTEPQEQFLYGPLREERSLGIYVQWQPVRDGFLDFRYRSFSLEDETTPSLNHGNQPEFTLTLRYGVW
jgi:hypothetical protein